MSSFVSCPFMLYFIRDLSHAIENHLKTLKWLCNISSYVSSYFI